MFLKTATYRKREWKWREEAATRTGVDRDACLHLADGYANLIAKPEQIDQRTDEIRRDTSAPEDENDSSVAAPEDGFAPA